MGPVGYSREALATTLPSWPRTRFAKAAACARMPPLPLFFCFISFISSCAQMTTQPKLKNLHHGEVFSMVLQMPWSTTGFVPKPGRLEVVWAHLDHPWHLRRAAEQGSRGWWPGTEPPASQREVSCAGGMVLERFILRRENASLHLHSLAFHFPTYTAEFQA